MFFAWSLVVAGARAVLNQDDHVTNSLSQRKNSAQYDMADASSPSDIPQRRSSRTALFTPFILLFIACVLWSGFWFWSKSQVAAAIETLRVAEATRGNALTCETETLGGYPFRLEWRCAGLQAQIAAESPDALAVRASSAVVVAQIYNPSLIIAEATGPVTVNNERLTSEVTFETARASVKIEDRLPARASIIATSVEGSAIVDGQELPSAQSASVELHIRRNEEDLKPTPDLDVVVRTNALTLGADETEWTSNVSATLFDVPSNQNLDRDGLRQWLIGPGSLGLREARITDGTLTAVGRGAIDASDTGLINGDIELGVSGSFSDAGGEGSGNANLTLLQTALSFFGRDEEVLGEPGRVVDVSIRSGAVQLGGLPVATLPPL